MSRSRMLARGGAAALGLAGLALAGCSSATHHAAATSAQPPISTPSPSARPVSPVANPVTVTVRGQVTRLGTVLSTGNGFTLYTFSLDKGGMSACTGTCATNWPPLTVGPGARLISSAAVHGQLGTITRPGGVRQATFDGHPLYRFAADTAPGQVHGQGVKGVWFVVRLAAAAAPGITTPTPKPAPPMSTPAPAPPASTAPANCIPQGGGGDGDADNSGGPSDGDGCT